MIGDDLRAPYRITFDNARDPYAARNALGIDSMLSSYLTTADAAATYLTTVSAAATYATIANFPAGAWTAWTPTITSSGGTITSTTINRARYIKAGKTITAHFDITITNAGTGSGFLQISLPVTASSAGAGGGFARETAVVGYMSIATINASGMLAFMSKYDGTTPITVNHRHHGVLIYEGA